MDLALTREVSPGLARCELTHLARQPIDVNLAVRQHRNYQSALDKLGCKVQTLPAEQDLPDSVFVEDVALVLDEIAVLCRPGTVSRRPEVDAIRQPLAEYRRLVSIREPGTLEGGDILRVESTIYVGISSRTNLSGIGQLASLTAEYGYSVQPITVSGCLHLKSAVTQVGENLLLINPDWVDAGAFTDFDILTVDASEPNAANALKIGGALIYPVSFPKTLEKLLQHCLSVTTVDVSELQKAEGAVTCCSLVFQMR